MLVLCKYKVINMEFIFESYKQSINKDETVFWNADQD